jgi:hypothetical protein
MCCHATSTTTGRITTKSTDWRGGVRKRGYAITLNWKINILKTIGQRPANKHPPSSLRHRGPIIIISAPSHKQNIDHDGHFCHRQFVLSCGEFLWIQYGMSFEFLRMWGWVSGPESLCVSSRQRYVPTWKVQPVIFGFRPEPLSVKLLRRRLSSRRHHLSAG